MSSAPQPLMLEGEVAHGHRHGGLHGGPATAHAPGQVNPLHLLHRHLRGRYQYAIPLALTLGLVGAVSGYFAVPPLFRSQGLVDVSPTTQSVLRGDNQPLIAGFEAFVDQQRAFLSSRRVIDRAVDDESMRRAGWPKGRDGVALLSKRLEVTARRGDRIVRVNVEHEEPLLASAAVNAVLNAYSELYIEADASRVGDRSRLLKERESALINELDKIRREVLTLGQEYGTLDTIDRLMIVKVGQMQQHDQQLAGLTMELNAREGRAASGAEERAAQSEMNYDALAENDPDLKRMLNYLRGVQSQYDAKRTQLGANHSEMRRLDREIEEARADVEKRAQALAGAGPGAGAVAVAKIPTDRLRELLERTKAERQSVSTEIGELNRKRSEIRQRNEMEAEKTKALNETRRLLDELQSEIRASEGAKGGRVRVAQNGDLPIEPSTDRRIPLAVGGGLGGVGVGLGAIFLLGLIRPRYRYIDDMESGMAPAPLLGTLPELASGEGEQDELAANSVHHLRNMLTLSPITSSGGAMVYTITSAAPGDGKTSASMALGMSFAASGQKTLLIDADLYGRGLTKSLNLRGKPGLVDAALGARLNGEIIATEYHNVWAMPSGSGEPADATILSKERVARILSEVREQFDVVIIDTGPILGSVEGNLLAALSDAVVLMVSRGQDTKLVRASLKRLGAIGARCAGMVFNRATALDFSHSMSHTSLRSRRQLVGDEAEEQPALADPHAPDERVLRVLSGASGSSAKDPGGEART